MTIIALVFVRFIQLQEMSLGKNGLTKQPQSKCDAVPCGAYLSQADREIGILRRRGRIVRRTFPCLATSAITGSRQIEGADHPECGWGNVPTP